jgi:alanine dehydrogenase
MRIGVPKETSRNEHRVGLTPFAVSSLVRKEHEVYIERGAGNNSHFNDEDYEAAGARIVYNPEEAYARADMVCRVGRVSPDEVQNLAPGTIVCGFQHLAVAPKEVVRQLREREATVIGYELIQNAQGRRAVMGALSEIAGRMTINTATSLLEHDAGGRGVLLGSVPGIPPSTVVILGAGTVGRTAASLAIALGAHVIVLDADIERLRDVNTETGGLAVTSVASDRNLRRFTKIADVLIGAVALPGGRAPDLVTEEMVSAMKPGSAILDLSIDQGGCVATSRPTTPDNPTFKVAGVTHYCVPNMTSNVPRTASRALSIVVREYLEEIAGSGIDAALGKDQGLAQGVFMYKGFMCNKPACEALGMDCSDLSELLG